MGDAGLEDKKGIRAGNQDDKDSPNQVGQVIQYTKLSEHNALLRLQQNMIPRTLTQPGPF
ncbi:hypothetical protein KOSB73_240260 [Klebsiella grimontii]|uniref:Uncharacterized protein n=1 Tax=Klebsiella grimontii TaxID=2058152 RepID=A0A285B2N2_9ENTR|nr:hypothetical protein KOSB73_240260 [Klebsiella grimontii]